jgi:anti-sigma regulatory factor (Ser/Thr protein kinase)
MHSVEPEPAFHARLHATPPSIAILRQQLRHWLEGAPFSAAEIFDIVLACSESLALVIEDQPRQVALVVDVDATLEEGEIVLRTRDYGLWHEDHARDRDEPLGLSLMHALVDSVEIQRHADGQSITLRKRIPVASGASKAREF